jgi:hypothetical protein
MSDLYDSSLTELCEGLVRYVDYDASSPVFNYNYMSTYRHYAESVFKVLRNWAGYDHTMLSIFPGPDGWVWRYFDEAVHLKGLYVETLVNNDTFSGKPDKWKVQYLVLGGDPNVESDWKDVPPISITYPVSSPYSEFTDYLVSNNDGEYYTNFLDSFGSYSFIYTPTSSLGYLNNHNKVSVIFNDTGIFSFYIEFDSSFYTQAARLVIDDGYTSKTRAVEATGYTFRRISFFTDTPTGSYTSPIFDTNTNQNTERIFINTLGDSSHVSVFYRSSNNAPEYKDDPKFEAWEDMGEPFAGLGNITSLNSFSVASTEDKIYFLCYNNDYMFYYDIGSRRWYNVSSSIYSSTSGAYYPDSRMLNNMISFGGNLYLAARDIGSGDVYNSVIMRYNTEPDEYNYSGWYIYPQQRPEGAITASMVSDGSRFIYCVSDDGVVISFDTSSGIYTVGVRYNMPLYGGVSRTNFVPGYYNGKLYVAGGTITYSDGSYAPCDNMDIFDIASGTWSVGSSMPYRMERTKCLVYESDIYVVRLGIYAYGTYVPYLKYSIEDDSWVVVESLGYNRANNWVGYSSGYGVVGDFDRPDAMCITGDYVYAYSDLKKDFRRFKVKKDSWSSGFLADKENAYWYGNGGIPWVEVFRDSEFLPQERYIQYKIQVTGDSDATVTGSIVVKPLPLRNVAPGEGRIVYVKTNLDSTFSTNHFYTSRLRVYD